MSPIADLGVDLIVMGGYGNLRLREMDSWRHNANTGPIDDRTGIDVSLAWT
jgi:hypothetical protein